MKLRQFLFEATLVDFKRQLKENKVLNAPLIAYLCMTEKQVLDHSEVNQEVLISVLTGLQLLDSLDIASIEPENIELFTFINSFNNHNHNSCLFEALSSLTRCAPVIAAQMQVKVNESDVTVAKLLNHAWHNYQCSKVVCEQCFSD